MDHKMPLAAGYLMHSFRCKPTDHHGVAQLSPVYDVATVRQVDRLQGGL